MTWQDLLDEKRVEVRQTSKQEIDSLREKVKRSLADAAVTAISDELRFSTAYSAALQLATITIRCSGYRLARTMGHHEWTFRCVPVALGAKSDEFAEYFDECRVKRNMAEYTGISSIKTSDVEKIILEAQSFFQVVEAWIAQGFPEFI